ncbi:MAG: hypothetical protein ACKPKO_65295, partial [Candidatus Fonsibacter sp.]
PDNHFIHSNIIKSSSTNQCEYAYNKNYEYIELSDGATDLSIKSGASTIMTMSPTAGIKHFTNSDFNNNYVYNIKEINGIYNILGSGIFAAPRGSFTYLQASGS